MSNLLPELSTSKLPATIEELQTLILIGKEKLKAHQAKIRAIDKVKDSSLFSSVVGCLTVGAEGTSAGFSSGRIGG
jgi:hypothetical protein